MGTLPHPWRGCSSECLFSLQKISFYHDETSPDATSSWSPSSSPCDFLWIENIHPPLFKYWDTVMKCPSAFSSPRRKKSHSSFLIGQSLQLSDHLCGSPLNLLQSVSWTAVTRAGHCTSDVAQQALCRMEFSHLFYLCQYHPCRCSPGFNFLFLLQSLTWGQVRQISQGAEITIWECVIAQMHTEAQILASVGLGTVWSNWTFPWWGWLGPQVLEALWAALWQVLPGQSQSAQVHDSLMVCISG